MPGPLVPSRTPSSTITLYIPRGLMLSLSMVLEVPRTSSPLDHVRGVNPIWQMTYMNKSTESLGTRGSGGWQQHIVKLDHNLGQERDRYREQTQQRQTGTAKASSQLSAGRAGGRPAAELAARQGLHPGSAARRRLPSPLWQGTVFLRSRNWYARGWSASRRTNDVASPTSRSLKKSNIRRNAPLVRRLEWPVKH